MVLPEEFVRLEDWKVVECSWGVETASLHQLHRQESNNIWLGINTKRRCFVSDHEWSNSSQTAKRSFLKLDQFGTIRTASLREDIQHWIQSLLTVNLAIDYHLEWLCSWFFGVASQQELALDSARDCANAWVGLDLYLRDEARQLSVKHDHDVTPTLMVSHLDPSPLVRRCPVWT